jgi:hypothetical protein
LRRELPYCRWRPSEKRSIFRWSRRDIFRAMSSWHCFVEERAEQMRMLRRGAAALVLIAPRRAFLAWGQHALATQRALAKLLRVFEPTRRLLGRAFNTLCDTADGMRSVRRAAAAMMHRQRRRALNAWRDGCASRERCLGLMHQGVAALVLLSAQVHNLRKQTHNLRKQTQISANTT